MGRRRLERNELDAPRKAQSVPRRDDESRRGIRAGIFDRFEASLYHWPVDGWLWYVGRAVSLARVFRRRRTNLRRRRPSLCQANEGRADLGLSWGGRLGGQGPAVAGDDRGPESCR